ncbi:MAG: GatB/YqeY domain-containing protein [Labilithrix sp.]|nr:GatB/YqeY domain-containing protein [Labilithrix sp.]MCW5815252.1 GatB/YqeY domain-containing protein [Labilithrix sp.]
MLIDDIKAKVTVAMKTGDTVARDVLRLALGEIQTAEARKSASLTDEEAGAVVRKLIKSNEETLGLSEGERAATLKKEIEVLAALLPKQLSVDEIVAALAPVKDAIVAAKADGQATGVAMKHLKSTGANVNGNDVGAAVKKLRS